MKHLLRPFSFSAIILLFAFSLTGSASAQWTAVGSKTSTPFTGQIHIVKFLDAVNEPLFGFVSDGPEIWRTTALDTGAAPGDWSKAIITSPTPNDPVPFITGWVNDISFQDPQNGAAIIQGNSSHLDSGVLLTTNGGMTWSFDTAAGTPDSGCGIYWNASNHLLFVASLDKGLVVSSDSGKTWSQIDTGNYFTGFAFTGPNRGVVATQGSNTNGFIPSNHWLYTEDGGKTWQKSRMFDECWQPAGIPTTETFYASTDEFISETKAILRSDDNGYSFFPEPGYLAPLDDELNESMQGDGCALFAASAAANYGLWTSTNEGSGWQTIPRAPAPAVDTRFYVSPSMIWSFTQNILEYAPRIGTPNIHIWPNTIAFNDAGCTKTSDTVVHIFGCNCENNDTLTAASVSQTETSDLLTANAGTLPQPLCSPSSAPLGIPDSVVLQYEPSAFTPDTGKLDLKFSENGVPVDTFVHIIGDGIASNTQPIVVPKRITMSTPACGEPDTCFEVVNTSCATVVITGYYLGGINETDPDKCSLHVNGVNFPITLNPGESFCYPVSYDGGIQKRIASATFSLNWQSQGGTVTGHTSTIEVDAFTTTTIQPSFRGFSFGFTTPMTCCQIPSEDTLYFVNSTCDTLQLGVPSLFGSTNPNTFRLDTAGLKPPLVFPVTLTPNEFIRLPIRIQCREGVDSTKVAFTYTVGTSGTDCAQVLTASDTAVLKIKSTAPIAPPTLTPNLLNFTGVSCCDSSHTLTLTITGGCKDDTLTRFLFNSASGGFDTISPGITLPLIIKANQKVTVTIGYRPTSGVTSNGSLSLTFSDGTQISSQIKGSCSSIAEAALSETTLDFDTLPCGTSKCDSVSIKNASCGPIEIGPITSSNPAFVLQPPASGTPLGVGDSVTMPACLIPGDSNGNLSGIGILTILDANGKPASFDTISLEGYVVPPQPADSTTQLATTNICDTSTLDESFTITNIGQCYTYDITGAKINATSGNGTQVTVTPVNASFPVSVAVGNKQIFSVHFDPNGQPVNLTGTITLTDSKGNNITVPYDITVTNCATQTATFKLTAPGNTIVTPNCTPGKYIFSGSAGGGTGKITSVSLTGSGRFSTTNSNGGTLPLTDTVIFDPNQAGSDTATLKISYSITGGATSDTTILLIGKTVGTKDSARIGVISPSDNCLVPNDTDLKEFDVIVRDNIPDTLGMIQVSFLIRYNGDLLWDPKTLALAPGFSVANEYEDNLGLHITLKYTNPGTGSIPANTTLIKITQLAALTNTLTGTARIDSAHFNDSAFEVCTLRALPSPTDSANICIDTNSCQRAVMLHGLQGTLQGVVNAYIIPNPAHKESSAATLHFTSNVNAPMTVDVLSVLGNQVAQLVNGPVDRGEHTLAIPTATMPEGAYFVRISTNGFTIVREFVLEKE